MSGPLFTASATDRVLACPASAALPRCDEDSEGSSRGRALHKFLERVPVVGRDAALEEVDEAHRDDCAALDLRGLPLDATKWSAEIACVWNAITDTGQVLGHIERDYADLGDAEIPGTCDVTGLADDIVVVIDYKTGWRAPRAADAGQLLTLALAECRALARDRAIVMVIRPSTDKDTTWIDRAEVDGFALDAHAHALRSAMDAVTAAKLVVARGGTPDVTIGAHCRYCPAMRVCPAHTQLMRQLTDEQALTALGELRPVSAGAAAIAFERVEVVRRVLELVEHAVFAFARREPVVLSDGRVISERVSRRETLDGPLVHRLVHELYGADAAAEACEYTATKKSLDAALRKIAAERAEPLAHLRAAVLDVLRAEGGVLVKNSTTVRPRRPRKGERRDND